MQKNLKRSTAPLRSLPARGLRPLQAGLPMLRADPEMPESQDIIDASRKRRCLMCDGHFASAWPGERICTKCKTGSAWRQGVGWSPASSRS
jgi:hypothetical protein